MNYTLDDVFKYIKTKHGVQTRTTGGYYFEHPRRVAAYVLMYKDSYKIDELITIALLHDILEDTNGTYEQLLEKFGELVANTVLELTNNKEEIEKSEKRFYLAKKMINMSSYALVVKLCDRLDNVSDLDKTDAAFALRYIEETEYILDAIDDKRDVISTTHHRLIHAIREKLDSYK